MAEAPATVLKNYDPAQVVLTIGGKIITGFGEGTFINLVRAKNNFELLINPTGDEAVRSKVNNRSALLTFTLMGSAYANLILSDLANRDEASSDGVVSVTIKDNNSDKTEYSSAKAYIEKTADGAFAATSQPRQWKLMMVDTPMVHGGTPGIAALASLTT